MNIEQQKKLNHLFWLVPLEAQAMLHQYFQFQDL